MLSFDKQSWPGKGNRRGEAKGAGVVRESACFAVPVL